MSNPVSRDIDRISRDIRRKMAKEAIKPTMVVSTHLIEDLTPKAQADRLGPIAEALERAR